MARNLPLHTHMEAALELEEDAFFKDLSEHLSLLIMDDDEDNSLSHCPSPNLQAFSQAIHPATHAPFLSHDQQTSKREVKGTGVFIPRSTNLWRKKAKQGRSTASGSKLQRPCYQNSRGLPQIAYIKSMSSPSYDHSFNFRRV